MTSPQPNFAAYEAAVAQVRAALAAYAAQLWFQIKFDDAAMERLIAAVVPSVVAGQMKVANLTAAYIARATGTQPIPVAGAVTEGRGVPPEVVYARPIIAARTAVARGKTASTAVEIGARRLESLVTTDLQMAKVRQADQSLQAAGQQYYRRVPKGTETCAMCLIASTQRYNGGTLMDIHPGCDCSIDVVPQGMDLDLVLDGDLLEATHQKVKLATGLEDRGARAPDYRKLLITHEHGELGELLTWRHQKFTSLDDLKD